MKAALQLLSDNSALRLIVGPAFVRNVRNIPLPRTCKTARPSQGQPKLRQFFRTAGTIPAPSYPPSRRDAQKSPGPAGDAKSREAVSSNTVPVPHVLKAVPSSIPFKDRNSRRREAAQVAHAKDTRSPPGGGAIRGNTSGRSLRQSVDQRPSSASSSTDRKNPVCAERIPNSDVGSDISLEPPPGTVLSNSTNLCYINSVLGPPVALPVAALCRGPGESLWYPPPTTQTLANAHTTVQVYRRQPWKTILTHWQDVHSQHDVAELLQHLHHHNPMPAFQAIWETRILRGPSASGSWYLTSAHHVALHSKT